MFCLVTTRDKLLKVTNGVASNHTPPLSVTPVAVDTTSGPTTLRSIRLALQREESVVEYPGCRSFLLYFLKQEIASERKSKAGSNSSKQYSNGTRNNLVIDKYLDVAQQYSSEQLLVSKM